MEKTAKNFYEFAAENIVVRIAVPDGFHKDQNYINLVKPGGTGEGATEHKNLFNVNSLSEIFKRAGFLSYPVEFWDERGNFHQGYTNDDCGYIKRSFINDKRNSSRIPVFTSLIIDFKKK